MGMTLEKFIETNRPKIDATLHDLLEQQDAPRSLVEAMRYSIDAGGKRIRPLLVLATLEDLDIRIDDALYVAAAVEFIHTYSLIHDDLPAMDDDDYRRGQLTNHKKFDEATAILAGDAMQALAFESITRTERVVAEQQVELIRLLSEAAGVKGMVAGQVLDLAGEQKQLTVEEIEAIHVRKTGALLSFSIEAGAILAQLCEDKREHLKRYAYNIGLAFQIKDDILDVTSTTEQLGKPAGSDEESEKSTYPALLGLEGAKQVLLDRHREAIESLAFLDKKESLLEQFANYIIERNI